VSSPSLNPNEKPSNAAHQIPDTDMWNEDNMHHSPSFILQTFTPKLQVCESEPRELKKEAMDNNDPNNYKFWRKSQKN
ncbi:Hypothetical predicted protein, partial [Marmota monax]